MSTQHPPATPPSGHVPLNAEVEVLELIARQVNKVPWPVGLAALYVLAMAWHQVPQWALLAWALTVIGIQAVRWKVLRTLPTSALTHAKRVNVAVLLSAPRCLGPTR